jgi:hypothetical protein
LVSAGFAGALVGAGAEAGAQATSSAVASGRIQRLLKPERPTPLVNAMRILRRVQVLCRRSPGLPPPAILAARGAMVA